MHPIVAHHAGEQALAPLLLLAGGGVSLAAAYGKAWLADIKTWLTRNRGSRQGRAQGDNHWREVLAARGQNG
jgi:hypothetical protein